MLRLINCNIATFSSNESPLLFVQPRVNTKHKSMLSVWGISLLDEQMKFLIKNIFVYWSVCYLYFCQNIPKTDQLLHIRNCQFILFDSYNTWLSPQTRHVCPVYSVSTPHVKASQISMKWSGWRKQEQTSPPAHLDVRKCQLSANQRRVWRYNDQWEGSMETGWPMRGQEFWTMEGGARGGGGQVSVFVWRVHYVYRWRDLRHNLDIFGIHHNATLLRSYPRG